MVEVDRVRDEAKRLVKAAQEAVELLNFKEQGRNMLASKAGAQAASGYKSYSNLLEPPQALFTVAIR